MDAALLGSIHIIQISARLPSRSTLKSPPGSDRRKVLASCALSIFAISMLVHLAQEAQLGTVTAARLEE
jgi:hypothetical protein